MVVVIAEWIYMGIICFLIGYGSYQLLKKLWKTLPAFSLLSVMILGITVITIYAELFSIVGKVGMAAHLILLSAAVITGVCNRRKVCEYFCARHIRISLWEAAFYCGLILFFAFFASRGEFHTDTNIYHAQNIRIYEEYGLIKGMANLQLHYGYNSAYLAFAAIFSMKWLLPWSLHTTTGFITALLSLDACYHLKTFRQRKQHLSDAGYIAILIYALVILVRSMSPATDFPTMFLSLYFITAWLRAVEQKATVVVYALLSVFAVFLGTMKLSAIAIAIAAVYPFCLFMKERKWKDILICIVLGVDVLLPYLIRNVLISGWLIYPFEKMDLFQVAWKVPVEYLIRDSNQIKVWARCLYDVTKVDLPLMEWLPVWWEGQARYEQYLFYACVIGGILALCNLFFKVCRKGKVNVPLLVLYLAIICSAGVWFFLAPFIRYGLSFLLVFPLIGIACWYDAPKKGLYSLSSGILVFALFLCLSPFIDNYVTDAGVFLKHNVKEPYYLLQKDYDDAATSGHQINGITIYSCDNGEINSYHYTPNTCYPFMLERSTLAGDSLKDGFVPIY